MKKIRLTAFILSLASCLFLFSAGFSTWFKVVLPTDIKPGTGEFTAYSVLDVVSSGTPAQNTFQYTSFEFVKDTSATSGFKNTISITYTFNEEDQPIVVTLGYENLSSYAGEEFDLFTNLIQKSYKYKENDVEKTAYNSINVAFTTNNAPVSLTVTDKDGTSTPETDGNFDVTTNYIKDGEIYFIITPGVTTLTITYTFNVPKTTESPGNFRQNLGKYLMAGGPDGDIFTKFISTVVAASGS